MKGNDNPMQTIELEALLKSIQKAQVRKKADAEALLKQVTAAIALESPTYPVEQQAMLHSFQMQFDYDIKNEGKTLPGVHHPFYPILFKHMRTQSTVAKAPKTNAAIVRSASWYYHNIEKPKDKTAELDSYGIEPTNPIFKEEEKAVQKKKYWKWGTLGLSMAVGAGLLYFVAFGKKDNPAPGRRRNKASSKRTVNRSRVRRHNKQQPPTRKKVPVIQMGTNLQNYRKNHERNKRRGKLRLR